MRKSETRCNEIHTLYWLIGQMITSYHSIYIFAHNDVILFPIFPRFQHFFTWNAWRAHWSFIIHVHLFVRSFVWLFVCLQQNLRIINYCNQIVFYPVTCDAHFLFPSIPLLLSFTFHLLCIACITFCFCCCFFLVGFSVCTKN